ncbi:MAG: hypothetical protein JNL11_08720 [Bdellovibrionaceae bacterium]|nr:hypothetical protein [Pseudobdellovibrionaceae bacterium]
MGTRQCIFLIFIYLTSCSSESQSSSETRTFNSRYYCEEFSISAPTNRNWRSAVLAELNEHKYPLFFRPKGGSDLTKYCPQFVNLSIEEKKIIYLRLIDAMVFFESSCNANAKAKGPNGMAYGLLQLHLGREQDYQRGCRQNDSKSSNRSLACGFGMLHDQVDQTNKLFFEGSYWDVLRPKGRSKKAKTISSHLWYYPLCHTKAEIKIAHN